MKSALYFPNLRGKRGELAALGHLSPFARARIRPLVDLPKPKADAKQPLEVSLSEAASGIAQNWGAAYPIYVDFSRFGPDETISNGSHPVEYVFGRLRQQGVKGIPVTGPESTRGPGDRYIKSVARVVQLDGRGVAVRMPFHEVSRPESLHAAMTSVLRDLNVDQSAVDLFVDLEAISVLPANDRALLALRAVVTDALEALRQWRLRTIVISGSSLPEALGKRHDWKPVHIARMELAVWRGLLEQGDHSRVRFGDYGVVYPFEGDLEKPVRPPSRVRLCSNEGHFIYRAKPSEYQALARVALDDKDLLDLPECWGAEEVAACARGALGASGATEWVARDTNIHLEATVRIIESDLRKRALFSESELEAPQAVPWLQKSIE